MFLSKRTTRNLSTLSIVLEEGNSTNAVLCLVAAIGLLVCGAPIANGDYTFGTPTKLDQTVNSGRHDAIASMSSDGLTLWMDSNRTSGGLHFDIWTATRADLSDPWGTPRSLDPPINSGSWDGVPCISADGLTLYFSSNRPGGRGDVDTWVTTRETVSGPWGAPVNLGSPVNSSAFDWVPSVTADGLSLYFASERSPGSGGWDIWVTTRAAPDDEWGAPMNLGPTVNSPSDEFPTISADGQTLFLTSNRPGGYGGRDIWISKRPSANDTWSEPVNLGPTINSSAWDQEPIISPDGSTLYFNSMRAGGSGLDIYQVPIDPVVDLNGDGTVDVKDVVIMTEHWSENYPLCDIGPTPLGDGIVDVRDLVVLAEHMEPDSQVLTAHWALDETEGMTAHERISGNNDVVTGGAVWRPTSGVADGALELDGVDDALITLFGPNPADGPFSVEAWVKGGAPGQVIISQPLGANLLALDAEGKLMTDLGSSGQDSVPLESQAVLTDGQWHRIGLVWDGSNRTLYVDSVVVAQDTPGGPGANASGLYIGVGNNYAAGTFFSGMVDDVRIYNRAVRP